MDVLNEIKPGLDEKLSERALAIELRKRGHAVESQKRFPVSYQNDLVGNLTPDLIVDEKVIVDFRVVAAFNDAHVAQMVGYLAITGLELALLLNLEARCATAKPAIFSARPSDLKPLIRAMSVIRG
jgi:GxxExxY protein